MAPIKKRTSMRARATAKPSTSTSKSTASDPNPAISASDLSSLKLKKQDKRHLKHAALLHKVRDASVNKSTTSKRRRPGKKMVATESLGGLRDALPEVEDDDEGEEWEGLSDDDGMDEAAGVGKKKRRRKAESEGKIKMRSLKHRPGAMKRKQVLEKKEQERFARNLAQLAGNEAGGKGVMDGKEGRGEDGDRQAQKWAALREFLGGTMERDKAFGKG